MKKRGLEIDEDLVFQRSEWVWQRIGIAVVVLVVAAALLGLTGMGGPLSHVEAADPGGAVRLEYDRFVRRGAAATVKLHLRTRADAPARFWISSRYFEHAAIESFTPQADTVSAEEGRHVYTLHSGAPDLTVTVELQHRTVGRIDGEVGLVDGPSVQFSQLSLF